MTRIRNRMKVIVVTGCDQDSYSEANSGVFKGCRAVIRGVKWKEMLEN